jgi:hypothetical protein
VIVFSTHVETFLDKALGAMICSWTNVLVGAMLVDIGLQTLLLESLFLTIEHN